MWKGGIFLLENIRLKEKIMESLASVLPLTAIVFILSITLLPLSSGALVLFLFGAVMLIIGMGFFTMGADMSMMPMGEGIGMEMSRTKNIGGPLLVCFILGMLITIAEPDLQVLAEQVPAIPNKILILSVAAGVGLFLMIAQIRIFFHIPLAKMLWVFYPLVFLLAFLAPDSFIPVSFDSGGVTTGPVTVPFIMALGIGLATLRSDKKSREDSFGLISLCSIGPILAVLLLGFLYPETTAAASQTAVSSFATTLEVGHGYLEELPVMLGEVAVALLPICIFFLLFQVFSLKLRKLPLLRILIGVGYTYVGLVLFLTGVNVGFSSLGYVLGGVIVEEGLGLLLIPLAVLMGWFIINAEPAVHVLNKQVEELSAGAISSRAMGMSLSIAVAAAMGLAMVRVLTGISILWFILPGYILALGLSFFVPSLFTAIAFDSGGVASGPLTATFMLPFAMGATTALGGNIMTDAFGLVALVAMMPLIVVQVMGAIYVVKTRRNKTQDAAPVFTDEGVIELWEVA